MVWLLALWLPLLERWSRAWQADAEMAHGWAVPLLAAYLAWQRWEFARRTPLREETEARAPHPVAVLVAWLGAALVAVTLPVLEVNALWPRAQWVGGIGAVAGTLGWLWWRGGYTAMRRYGFAVAFLLTAITWPSMVRAPLVNTLTEWHAALAAEVVTLGGRAAVVRGHIIEVEQGLIGVEEACSGLRSLQAVWMFAWFFGELHRLAWSRRLRLVVAAMITAVGCNVGRTIFLTWQAGAEGGGQAAQLHDAAGLVVLFATLVITVLYALRLAGQETSPATRTGPLAPARQVCSRWRPTPIVAALGLAVAAGGVEAGGRVWFAEHQGAHSAQHWSFAAPIPGWERLPLSEEVLQTLQCSSAEQWRAIRTWDGLSGLAMLFRWEEDRAGLSTLTNAHDPTVCMPAIGAALVATPAPVSVEVDGRLLVFDVYVFEAGGQRQTVFNAVWDATEGEATPRAVMGAGLDSERLQRVWRGRRFADRDRIVFVLQEDVREADAVAWLRREATAMLRMRSASGDGL